MDEMKGIAKTMMIGQSATNGRVELARYADGSWAIRKNGPTIGVWEPHEEDECFRVFGLLAGLDDLPESGRDLVIRVRRGGGAAAVAAAEQWN